MSRIPRLGEPGTPDLIMHMGITNACLSSAGDFLPPNDFYHAIAKEDPGAAILQLLFHASNPKMLVAPLYFFVCFKAP